MSIVAAIGGSVARFRHIMLVLLLSITALVASGCSASVSSDEVKSCASASIGNPQAGTLSVQQASRGSAIQWGLYVAPKYKVGASFVVNVYADGVKIDGANQTYEPHGSVSAARAAKYAGKILEVSGSATRSGDILEFKLQCRIM